MGKNGTALLPKGEEGLGVRNRPIITRIVDIKRVANFGVWDTQSSRMG